MHAYDFYDYVYVLFLQFLYVFMFDVYVLHVICCMIRNGNQIQKCQRVITDNQLVNNNPNLKRSENIHGSLLYSTRIIMRIYMMLLVSDNSFQKFCMFLDKLYGNLYTFLHILLQFLHFFVCYLSHCMETFMMRDNFLLNFTFMFE